MLIDCIPVRKDVDPEDVIPGTTVIGIHCTSTGLTGDVRTPELDGRITPVPGGVGPMAIAMFLANTLRAAQHRARPPSRPPPPFPEPGSVTDAPGRTGGGPGESDPGRPGLH
ncbi:hypothetical protein PUR57_03205 [Streptomyces sp. JV176]|uniref:hypothetical protein n=1 Tax=Streptomyces sp. JV176 TaxID=858630 RepID=UPI002E78D437|nr:hypothetical protein [Streptomyces sp. JV176]MEE1797692.1 hypothetical protein [Streptomyces sp. JV176]